MSATATDAGASSASFFVSVVLGFPPSFPSFLPPSLRFPTKEKASNDDGDQFRAVCVSKAGRACRRRCRRRAGERTSCRSIYLSGVGAERTNGRRAVYLSLSSSASISNS